MSRVKGTLPIIAHGALEVRGGRFKGDSGGRECGGSRPSDLFPDKRATSFLEQDDSADKAERSNSNGVVEPGVDIARRGREAEANEGK